MRLYNSQVPVIADEILDVITKNEDIEVLDENLHEVRRDIEAVIREWIRMDREITEEARDIAARDSSMSIGRAKHRLAKRMHFKTGDEGIDYIIDQLTELFMHSNYVEEVFASDHELRKLMRPVIIRHTKLEDTLDKEVRSKLKNLQEGSMTWEVEYQKVMSQLRHAKNLD